MVRSDPDLDVFLSKAFELRDDVSDLEKVVSYEHLTTINLDALPTKKQATINTKAIRNLDLSLEEITNTMKIIFINHSDRSSVPKRIQEPYRKSRDNSGEPTMNGRESAMTTVFTCHNCKKREHKKKDCNRLNKRPDK